MVTVVAGDIGVNIGLSATGSPYTDADVTSSSPTQIVLHYASGFEERFGGVGFTFDDPETVTGGLVTSYQVFGPAGLQILNATGLNLSVLAVRDMVVAGNNNAILTTSFGGDDQIWGSTVSDRINGGAGADSIIALDGADTVHGGAGDDDVNGNVGDDQVFGDDGADFVRGGKGDDTVFGGLGSDPHVNGNIGNDQVFGQEGNDTCYGGQGSDTVHGGNGDDFISGDLGDDILFGEAGADRFTIAKGGGFDWIGDFNAADGDRIVLAAGTAYTVSAVSGQVFIDLGGGGIGLAGVAAGSFSADWIVYA